MPEWCAGGRWAVREARRGNGDEPGSAGADTRGVSIPDRKRYGEAVGKPLKVAVGFRIIPRPVWQYPPEAEIGVGVTVALNLRDTRALGETYGNSDQ